jgi:hypothetical protein
VVRVPQQQNAETHRTVLPIAFCRPWKAEGLPGQLQCSKFVQRKKIAAISGEIKLDFVNIAPTPALAGFQRSHDRMLGSVEVFGCVPILRRVAASDMAARHA